MTISKQAIIERRILEHYTALDHNRQFVNPPATDDELHEFIQLGFGINVPRTRVVPHHRSPFEFIADLYFERVSNVLGFANRTGGKCLALDTQMLTTNGWSTMGDLEVGDRVFAVDGDNTLVISTSEVHLNHDCYRIIFDGGSEIVADANHEWLIEDENLWIKKETTRQLLYRFYEHEVVYLVASTNKYTGVKESRFIVHIEPIKSVPVRCIGVDHPSHLYLAGSGLVPTHNTLSVSILNFLDMFFKPGCEIASAGATLAQTGRSYEYFSDFLEAEWFKRFENRYYKTFGEKFVVQTIKAKTLFASGSKLEILTGTEKGFRSPHPHKARLDEIDEMEWSLLNTAFSMTKSSNGIQAQNVFTSTRQNERGTMQKLLDEASAKGIDIYEWNIWEAVQKCPRRCVGDPKHGDCPIKAFCEGRAHSSDGFYSVTDFITKVKLLDRESWETEWLNLRPSRDKLVYSKFQNSKHVMTPEKLWKMTKLNAPSIHWPRVGGIDFGSSVGHPFVYLKAFQMPNGAWLIYHEYYAEADLLRNHAAAIRSSPFYVTGETIYADWDAQDRLELAALGVRTQRAMKDVNAGIDYVKTLFAGQGPANGEEPMLYIWHECRNLIEELGLYQYNIVNGKPSIRDAPKKENDHGSDVLRYILFSHKSRNPVKYRSRRIEGV